MIISRSTARLRFLFHLKFVMKLAKKRQKYAVILFCLKKSRGFIYSVSPGLTPGISLRSSSQRISFFCHTRFSGHTGIVPPVLSPKNPSWRYTWGQSRRRKNRRLLIAQLLGLSIHLPYSLNQLFLTFFFPFIW